MPTRKRKLFPTPDDAETAFYEAFERGDLAAMMAVWAETDDVVCVHPRGGRLVGFDAVRDSWVQIFAGATQARVRTSDARRFDGQEVAVRCVIEAVSAPGAEAPPQLVSATNVFRLTDAGWRMVLHHASPLTEPERIEEPAPPTHTLH